ncbi:hypothetical protein B0H14DRAFT_2560389 [Mycena olivaceomarginata]|nr:hypothetical protein B0H14DRAFT_2560389 [Mycena olivaceomarginata]
MSRGNPTRNDGDDLPGTSKVVSLTPQGKQGQSLFAAGLLFISRYRDRRLIASPRSIEEWGAVPVRSSPPNLTPQENCGICAAAGMLRALFPPNFPEATDWLARY